MSSFLPKDDYMLLSLVNTKLRDGEDLQDFCSEYCCSTADICGRMEKIGYKYDDENNTFKAE